MANPTQPATLLDNSFLFNDNDVRIAVDKHGEMHFCAQDVCSVLEIKWSGSGNTLRSLPERWVFTSRCEGEGGYRDMVFISEPGLYKLIFRSNKPEAVRFADWVCEEVLPAIRKTGSFGSVPARDRLAYSKQVLALADKLTDTTDAMLYKLLVSELRNMCNLIGQKMPDLALLGKDYKQIEMSLLS